MTSGPSQTVAFRDTTDDDRLTSQGHVRHQGVDLSVPRGQLVIAATSGHVTASRWDGTGLGGWLVIIEGSGASGSKYRFLYAHLMLPPFVKGGDTIEAGQLLGLSGDTGGLGKGPGARFSGPHLHFSCAKDGAYVNLTDQLATLVTPVRPGVYALPEDVDGVMSNDALHMLAASADKAPSWYIKQLASLKP